MSLSFVINYKLECITISLGIHFQAFIIDLITDVVKTEVTSEKQKFARNEEKENNIC